MRAVLEAVEGNVARFIPDDESSPIHIPLGQVPSDVQIGSVCEVTVDSKGYTIRLLSSETQKRRNRIKAKREALLKRKKRM